MWWIKLSMVLQDIQWYEHIVRLSSPVKILCNALNVSSLLFTLKIGLHSHRIRLKEKLHYASHSFTGCPRMFYTQKCKFLRILITIKTIEFDILIYLSDRTVLLAFWRILNQGNQPNKTKNTWHYAKRVIFCILIEVGKEGFMSYSV